MKRSQSVPGAPVLVAMAAALGLAGYVYLYTVPRHRKAGMRGRLEVR